MLFIIVVIFVVRDPLQHVLVTLQVKRLHKGVYKQAPPNNRRPTAKKSGPAFDVFDPAAMDAAMTRMRDMAVDDLRRMSERGMTRGDALALTPAAWADGLVALYARALAGAGDV